MTLLNAYSKVTLIEPQQIGKLNLCYKRKAHRMTSKHRKRVIDLVINLSSALHVRALQCVSECAHINAIACCLCLKRLLLFTYG